MVYAFRSDVYQNNSKQLFQFLPKEEEYIFLAVKIIYNCFNFSEKRAPFSFAAQKLLSRKPGFCLDFVGFYPKALGTPPRLCSKTTHIMLKSSLENFLVKLKH